MGIWPDNDVWLVCFQFTASDSGRIPVYLELLLVVLALIAPCAIFKAVQMYRVRGLKAQIDVVDDAVGEIQDKLQACVYSSEFVSLTGGMPTHLFMLHGREWEAILQTMEGIIEECEKLQRKIDDPFWRRQATPAACQAILAEYRGLLAKLQQKESELEEAKDPVEYIFHCNKRLNNLEDVLEECTEELKKFQRHPSVDMVISTIAVVVGLQQEVAATQGSLADVHTWYTDTSVEARRAAIRPIDNAISRLESECSQLPAIMQHLKTTEGAGKVLVDA